MRLKLNTDTILEIQCLAPTSCKGRHRAILSKLLNLYIEFSAASNEPTQRENKLPNIFIN